MLYRVSAYINKSYTVEADSKWDAITMANEIMTNREDVDFSVDDDEGDDYA